MAEHGNDTILLIEPDPDVSTRLAAVLRRVGLRLLSAQGHMQGITLLDDTSASLALVPVEATDIDGFEFCQLIRRREREQRREFVYLILLGEADQRRRIAESRAEADDFLITPYRDEELLWRIRSGLRLVHRLVSLQERLRFDPESNVLNPSGLRLCLQDEVNRAARRQSRLSLLLVCLKGLDLAEQSYGLDWITWLEDRLLDAVRESLRSYDSQAKLARGSLCLVLPDTEPSGLRSVLHRIEAELDRLLQSFPGQGFPEVDPQLFGVSLKVLPDYSGVFEAVERLVGWVEEGLRSFPTGERVCEAVLSRDGMDIH